MGVECWASAACLARGSRSSTRHKCSLGFLLSALGVCADSASNPENSGTSSIRARAPESCLGAVTGFRTAVAFQVSGISFDSRFLLTPRSDAP